MKPWFIIFFLLASQLVNAAAKTWTGNTSTDWATATNWSGNTLPAAGDDVTIPTSPAGGRMPTISANYTVKSITIQTGATLTHTSGVLSSDGGDLNVTGTYLISGGTFLTDNALTVNATGLISQSGGTIHLALAIGTNPTDHLVIAANADFSLTNGTLDVRDLTTTAGSPNGVFTQSGGTLRMYHDFKNRGNFTATGGTIEFADNGGGGSFPIEVTSSNTQFYNVVINSGIDPAFTNQIISFNVAGNWTNNSSGLDLSGKATTVIFNGSGAQTIDGSQSTTFRNMTIDKSGGTATLGANQTVNSGNLNITGGTFDIATYTVNRSASGGSMTLSNGCILKLASNTGGQTGSNFPLNYTTITLNATSTVEYHGSNAVTQTIYAGATYGHLTLTNGSGSGLASKITTANLTVNSNLTINTLAVLTPAAANTVGGTGTLTGVGTVQVTRTTATADFNTQYSISNKTLTNLTVDYFATGAQSVNALNYFNLTISGARTTNSVTLVSSGTIGVSGTFTPSATFTSGNYVITSSTVDFNGSSAQNIPAFTFNNLIVSNSTKTATGVINVNTAFTLSSVVLNTTSSNILIIKDNATATGASFTSYVNGPVRKVGDDAFTFPVGKSGTGYMSIAISTPSSATDAFTAEYMRASGTSLGSITASGLYRVSNCDYWNLDRTTGSSTINVTLSWNGYTNCNAAAFVTDLPSLTVAHFNGTSWDSHGSNSYSGNVSSGTVTRNSVSAFSPFTIGSTTDQLNPLPLQFTSVKAYRQTTGIKVEWVNLAEENIAHYQIERSSNGSQFVTAGQVPARINGGNKTNYDWLDMLPVNGTNYYRIKAVDINGNYNYSTIIKVDVINNSVTTVYPNPVTGNKLNLATANMLIGKYEIQIYDMNSRKIQSQPIVHNGAIASYDINLPENMKPGVYSLRIKGNNLNEVKTFLFK